MTSAHFAADLTDAIDAYRPALVQLDPLYVYFGEDREAGNVFSTGPALVRLRELTTGRALQVAHHFTKVGADRLTLASLTQAGMREAVDHWLLIAVKEHDLALQRFVLDLERGARRGLAWSRTAEVVLGPFDHDTLRHSGTPSVKLEARTPGESHSTMMRLCAGDATRAVAEAQRLAEADGQDFSGLSGRVLVELIEVPKASREAKRAGIEEAVRVGALRTEPGPRRSTLHLYVHDYQPTRPPPDDDDDPGPNDPDETP